MTDGGRTARPDDPVLADDAQRWRSAYIHIPFCRRRCPYCDFAVVTPQEQPAGASVVGYVDAIVSEIGLEPAWSRLDAVNFGGGTPSTLEPAAVVRILEALEGRFGIAAGAEVSLEANPEDITPRLIEGLAGAGVTRVSLGVQSFDRGVLRRLGRTHDPATATSAFDTARRGGIRSVSLDLIYGTAAETVASWEDTVRQAVALQPDHLSAYSLTVERGTALSRAVASGEPAPDPDLQADMYEALTDIVAGSDLVHYEVSNYARPGHTCRYNLATWAQGEYVAFGLGAHGHRNGRRRRNVRRLDRYLADLAAGRRPEAGAEQIDGWAAEQERLLLGLRRRAGVASGRGGPVLLASSEGRRLMAAGVLEESHGRLVVARPLLGDAVNRAVMALPDPDG